MSKQYINSVNGIPIQDTELRKIVDDLLSSGGGVVIPEEEMVTTDIVDGVLNLTTDKYQKTTMVDGTEIVLPTVSSFTEINLHFDTTSDLTLTLPAATYQNGVPTIVANRSYIMIFIYIDKWLAGVIEYGGSSSSSGSSGGTTTDYGPYSIQYNSSNDRLEFIYNPNPSSESVTIPLTWIDNTVISGWGMIELDELSITTDFIQKEDGYNYTISLNNTTSTKISFWNSSQTFISRSGNYENSSAIISFPEGTRYFRVSTDKMNSITINNVNEYITIRKKAITTT